MAYKINFTRKGRESIAAVVDYLELEWSEKVAVEFIANLNQHLKLLASGILSGKPSETRGVKSVLVSKHNRLYYRIESGEIPLLLLWDIRQNPTRHPYE